MPEKHYGRCTARGCLRCWQNRMKHGNKWTKAYVKAHGVPFLSLDGDYPIEGDQVEHIDIAKRMIKADDKREIEITKRARQLRQIERKSIRATRIALRRRIHREEVLDKELSELLANKL